MTDPYETSAAQEPVPHPAGFLLTVPDSWFEVDLRPSTREASINALVYDRVKGNPELREARPAIVRVLRDFAGQAAEAGAVYCACFVQPTTEGPITGSVTVTLIDAPPAAGVGPDPVLDLLAQTPVPSGEGLYRTVGIATIEGVGPVARTYGVEDIALPDEAGHVRTIMMQTFVPLAGSRQMLLVSASSPVLWLEEELLDLFDAVSSTLRLVDQDVSRD